MSIGPVKEYTTYFDLEVPTFDFPAWHTYYERNLKTIDGIMYLMTGTNSLKGVWKNSTIYNIGDRVVDIDVAFAYECFIQHTSAPVPTTFAQDRVLNPDYWHAVDFIQALAGTSITTLTIGLGIHDFVTQSGRVFVPGAKVMATDADNPTVNWMWGSVVSYDGQDLVLDVEVIGGSGTYSDWLLSVSGVRGTEGPIGPIGVQGPTGDTGPTGPQGEQGEQGLIEEAPNSGSVYGRNGLTEDWEVVAATSADVLPITPAGTISSTTVQAAIYELDNEKLAKTGGTMTGHIVLPTSPGTTNAVRKDYVDAADLVLQGNMDLKPTTAYVDAADALRVLKSGDTMTGTLVAPAININSTLSDVSYFSSSTPTWIVRGSNNATNPFEIYRYNGGYALALNINRTTGDVALERDLTMGGVLRTSASLAFGLNVSTGFYGDGGNIAVRGYGGGGIYFQSSGGALTYGIAGSTGWSMTGPINITGALNATTTIAASGAITSSGNISASGELKASNGVVRLNAGGDRYLYWDGGNYQLNGAHLYTAAGRVWGSSDFNPASFLTAGGITMNDNTAIEGAYYIDLKAPGHAAHDYCTRLLAAGDHGFNVGLAGGYMTVDGPATFTGVATRNGTTGTSDWGQLYNWLYLSGYMVAFIGTTNVGAFTSDYRAKKDITPLPTTWDIVKQLKPISYTHQDYQPAKDKKAKGAKSLIEDDDIVRWGFLAHELQEALTPSAASGFKDDPDTLQSPNPFTLIAALTKALQEAMERIETLEAAYADAR